MKLFSANASQIIEQHLKVSKVLDGDSIIVTSIFNKSEKEIRLYGLDAPETKMNRKLKEDEKKTHVAGKFLIQLGILSLKYILTLAPPETKITIITENENFYDFYGRQLAYVILPDGTCLNEILVREGYAKAFNEYSCTELAYYQELNFAAMQQRRGLYEFAKKF